MVMEVLPLVPALSQNHPSFCHLPLPLVQSSTRHLWRDQDASDALLERKPDKGERMVKVHFHPSQGLSPGACRVPGTFCSPVLGAWGALQEVPPCRRLLLLFTPSPLFSHQLTLTPELLCLAVKRLMLITVIQINYLLFVSFCLTAQQAVLLSVYQKISVLSFH